MENKALIIKAQIQISKLPAEVYEAIIDPAKMFNYFIAQSNWRMESNASLEWQFPEFDIKIPVRVGKLRKNEYISFYWNDADGKKILMEINLLPAGIATHIVVTEKEREADEDGIRWLGRNTEGWANFLAYMKAYLEYGINLRKGAFDFMAS
ncbi:MAG: SRPBCC domain-containing protein [Rhizobacter sp.]|nr:SRPBCC domain-containing protein [Ferruginibacter sp.]